MKNILVILFLLISGIAFANDNKKAEELYVKGFKEVDNGNSKDALKYWEESCNLNYSNACVGVGLMYAMNIKGITKDDKKSYDYYVKACDLGSSEGCLSAGNSCLDGIGVKKDKQAAKDFYSKACKLDNEKCDALHNLK